MKPVYLLTPFFSSCLRVAHNRLRLVGLLQIIFLIFAQLLPTSVQRLVHPLYRTKSNDRRANPLIDPRKRNMAHLPPLLLRQLLHALHDLAIRLALLRTALLLPLTPRRRPERLQRPRQVPPAERRPRNQAHARRIAEGVHLALLFAVQQVVVVLHTNELRPAVLLGRVLQQRELPGPHAGGADVVHFPGTHEVVQGLHGFFQGRVRVEAVDLQEVEVVELEAPEGGVDGFEDGGAREAWS